jgi:hypothetical protein
MRVLLETSMFSHKELLALIAEERRRHDGPATVTLSADDATGAAA